MNTILAGQTSPTEDPLAALTGPSPSELAAIEAESELIAFESELVEAEVELLDALAAAAANRGELTELEVRRIRRARRVVLARTLIVGITRESLARPALDGAA